MTNTEESDISNMDDECRTREKVVEHRLVIWVSRQVCWAMITSQSFVVDGGGLGTIERCGTVRNC